MNQFVIALMAMMLVLSGCASTGGATSADNGGLPEIAPYDEATYDPLPEMVPAT
jgi:uncharacterized protein YceK